MRRKLLVTGSNGFVAGSVIEQAKKNWEVHGISRSDPPPDTDVIKYYKLDLLESGSLHKLFHNIKPDAVIHTAAIAGIDFCQNYQNVAEKINVGITETLARLCEKSGTKLVFCSTDTVFDGNKGFYSEDDEPSPINFYAETKIKAENIIKDLNSHAVIARLSLVIGLPVMGQGNSFLSGTIEKMKSGETIKAFTNEVRTPIDVITLGSALIELAENSYDGIIHLAGNTRLSRYGIATEIAKIIESDNALIISSNSDEMTDRAPRPEDVSLDNAKAGRILKTPMLSLVEGLRLTLNYRNEN